VRHIAIDFLKPAAVDDLLLVRTAPARITGARAVLAQTVQREADILASAIVTVALVGPRGVERLPPALRDALSAALTTAP
jgi:acyl-CoA thioester hydrolase